MRNVEITKEQLLTLIFVGNLIGMGTYGIIKQVNSTTLAKIYYKEIINTYLSKDSSKLDEEIEMNKEIQKMINERENFLELKELEQKKLQYLYEINLVKGILFYKNYKIGVLLNYYKDYSRLTDMVNKLNFDDLYFVVECIKFKLEEMMQNGLFLLDLREDNILVRQRDLDIKFIDLDDSETRFEKEDYVLNHSYIKNDCLEQYKQMRKRILKIEKMGITKNSV